MGRWYQETIILLTIFNIVPWLRSSMVIVSSVPWAAVGALSVWGIASKPEIALTMD